MKKLYLTSSLVNYIKVNGTKIPCIMDNTNCMVDILKTICNDKTNILLIPADPNKYNKNDEMRRIIKKSFKLSNVLYKEMIIFDSRNEKKIDNYLKQCPLTILLGGHLPTQNDWFRRLNLKEKMQTYDGYIIGQSAGSMNCATKVYSCPEREEEIKNARWLEGLDLTNINIFPHYKKYKNVYLGKLKMIEDIVLKDSQDVQIYALNDGSFIEVAENRIIYGECYKIFKGQINKICSNGEKRKISSSS